MEIRRRRSLELENKRESARAPFRLENNEKTKRPISLSGNNVVDRAGRTDGRPSITRAYGFEFFFFPPRSAVLYEHVGGTLVWCVTLRIFYARTSPVFPARDAATVLLATFPRDDDDDDDDTRLEVVCETPVLSELLRRAPLVSSSRERRVRKTYSVTVVFYACMFAGAGGRRRNFHFARHSTATRGITANLGRPSPTTYK